MNCVLTGVTTDATDRAELHTHIEENGVMKMTRIDSIAIPAHGSATLARGSDHIMLLALPTPLNEGDTLILNLDMGECGILPVRALVDSKRPAAPMMHGGQGKAMGGAPAN